MTARKPLYLSSSGNPAEVPASDTLAVRGGMVAEGDVGDGVSSSIDFVHGFNLTGHSPSVTCMDNTTGDNVIIDVKYKDANTVTLGFRISPDTNQYHITARG